MWRAALTLADQLGAVDGLATGVRMSQRGALLAEELGLKDSVSPYLRLSVESEAS